MKGVDPFSRLSLAAKQRALETWKQSGYWPWEPMAIILAAKRKEETMVKLGAIVRDKISGFKGTVTARTTYMNGCVRVQVEGPMKDGKEQEFWFDEQRLGPSRAKVGGPGAVAPSRDPNPR